MFKNNRRQYIVTHLEDDGKEGSLRYGVNLNEPVHITFAIAGTIELQSRLWISDNYTTIDGEDAPGTIIIKNNTVYIRASHVVLRFLTIGAERVDVDIDSVWILLASDVLIEYCTIYGGSDEIISATRSDGVLIQHCIIANPMKKSHGFGCILSGIDDHSINYCLHNLFINCTGRTPNVGIGNSVIAYNIIYNYGHMLSYTTNHKDAVILQVSNEYITGPQTIRDYMFMFPSRPSRVTLLLEHNTLDGKVSRKVKNETNGILLTYNTRNGRLKIVPSDDVRISNKELRKLYHRLDKLARQLLFERYVKGPGEPTPLETVGNYKHRSEIDQSVFSQLTNKLGYTFPSP